MAQNASIFFRNRARRISVKPFINRLNPVRFFPETAVVGYSFSMSEILFCTAIRRLLASAILGFVTSFVIGSFLSFFIFFTAQAVEGQSNDAAKSIIFRVYAAIFMLAAFSVHLFGSLKFRSWERKPPVDSAKPRPAICAAIAAIFLVLTLIPSTTETRSESFEYADNPIVRESAYGWPATFVIRRDIHGKKESEWSRAFLFVNALVLVLGLANVLAFDPGSRTEEELAQKKDDDKPKDDDDDSDGPPPPPLDDAPDLRKALSKESSKPQTLSLD